MIPIQSELPALLGTSADNAAWVLTTTLLAAAVAMPVAGRLADLFGKQRVLAVSAASCWSGRLVCALSDSLVPMLAGRTLQGLAMGFIPVGISLMREITPPHLTSTAIAAMSATLGVGGAIGLPLSAWIADRHDWHALFWVSAVLALVIVVATAVLVPHVHDGNPGRLDVVGVLGLAVGLVAFLIGISKSNQWGWGDPRTLGSIAFGLAVLLAWGWYELRHDEPFDRPAYDGARSGAADQRRRGGHRFRHDGAVGRRPAAAADARGHRLRAGSVASRGGPLDGAGRAGDDGLRSGLQCADHPAGRQAHADGGGGRPRRWLSGGFALMGAPWQLLLASCVASAGVGIGYAAMPTLILDSVPMHEAASAVGLNALMRSVGTTLAAATMATVLTHSSTTVAGHVLPNQGAFQLCFVIGAAAAFLGVAIAATIPRRRDPVVVPAVQQVSAV